MRARNKFLIPWAVSVASPLAQGLSACLFIFFSIGFLLGISPCEADAQAGSENSELEVLAKQLASLENEVQVLYDEVKTRTESIRNEDRMFQARKAEIESDIQRKDLKLKQVLQELDKQTALLKKQSEEHSDIVPVVMNGTSILKNYIDHSMPFKKEDRLRQVSELEEKVNPEKPVLLPERALNTLWAYYEDEIRLNREHGIYKQTIRIDNSNVLADVMKIGMTGMFYLTPDGRSGVIRRAKDGSWKQIGFERSEFKEDVAALMDAFRKQVRTGYFQLPAFLPEGDSAQ